MQSKNKTINSTKFHKMQRIKNDIFLNYRLENLNIIFKHKDNIFVFALLVLP